MDTAKKYQDLDGNDCSLWQMVRREPDWAATRIQEGEKAVAELEKLRSGTCEWVESGDGYWETCGPDFVNEEGTLSETGMKYCCYCGKPLVEIACEDEG